VRGGKIATLANFLANPETEIELEQRGGSLVLGLVRPANMTKKKLRNQSH